MKTKRNIEIVVISDIHLGTYECQANQLLTYLNSISPKKLILNGDIVDIWQFKNRYFPKSHLKVVKKLMNMASDGVEIIYITGNHDDKLRKFSDVTIGKISIVNKVVLDLDNNKRAWFFHGDVFDASIQNAKWLAKLGGYGFDMLMLMNQLINWGLQKTGREKLSLSKKIKDNGQDAVKYKSNFEKTVSDLAIKNGYDFVVCGHIHQPKMKLIKNNNGTTTYLNSGDWVENLTALEFQFNRWKIYHYNKDKLRSFYADEDLKEMTSNDLIAAITVFDNKKK